MSRVIATTWFWGDKYTSDDVRKLCHGVSKNLQLDRLIVIGEYPYWDERNRVYWSKIKSEDLPLTKIKGCFARLRMFDPNWQAENGINVGDRIINFDLDSVVTGELNYLVMRTETFMILQGANAANPCPFNGSVMMLRAGYHREVWDQFSLDRANAVPKYEFADDQGWLHHMLPDASGWKAGSPSGIYAFQKPGWPKGTDLPSDARLVVFPGWRSPKAFSQLSWIKEHWV